jgi:hypothetical protein
MAAQIIHTSIWLGPVADGHLSLSFKIGIIGEMGGHIDSSGLICRQLSAFFKIKRPSIFFSF